MSTTNDSVKDRDCRQGIGAPTPEDQAIRAERDRFVDLLCRANWLVGDPHNRTYDLLRALKACVHNPELSIYDAYQTHRQIRQDDPARYDPERLQRIRSRLLAPVQEDVQYLLDLIGTSRDEVVEMGIRADRKWAGTT